MKGNTTMFYPAKRISMNDPWFIMITEPPPIGSYDRKSPFIWNEVNYTVLFFVLHRIFTLFKNWFNKNRL